jgi:hypothetical protein
LYLAQGQLLLLHRPALHAQRLKRRLPHCRHRNVHATTSSGSASRSPRSRLWMSSGVAWIVASSQGIDSCRWRQPAASVCNRWGVGTVPTSCRQIRPLMKRAVAGSRP